MYVCMYVMYVCMYVCVFYYLLHIPLQCATLHARMISSVSIMLNASIPLFHQHLVFMNPR